MDHDQRFKVLLEEFFPELFELFWPEWTTKFDFASRTWLKEELFTDPPQGERLRIDLVAKLKLKEPVTAQQQAVTEWLALVHTEIESRESAGQLRSRMYQYYHELRRTSGLPVLPVAILLNVGLQGLGIDHYEEVFGDFRPLHFQYLYVGLPALDGEDYLGGSNLLGIALSSLMNFPVEVRAKRTAEALDKLVNSSENMWRKFLLCECVQAYSPMTEAQKMEFNALLVSERYSGVRNMNQTWYERGEQQGIEKGVVKGQITLLQNLLEFRFGTLSQDVKGKLQALPAERISELGRALFTAKSLHELGLED